MRFKRVEDVRKLERQLDNLIITGLKLHANLPKHEMTVEGAVNRGSGKLRHRKKREIIITKKLRTYTHRR